MSETTEWSGYSGGSRRAPHGLRHAARVTDGE